MERLALIAQLWDSLDAADVPVTSAQCAELARRLHSGEGLERAIEEGAPRECAGVLVDEEFGAAVARKAKAAGLPFAMPVEKSGQDVFDFGRSTPGSGPYNFKTQWGASPTGAEWQSYLRAGCLEETRPDNPRYRRLINVWQRLPVWLTRQIGPRIVRGIP